MPAWTRADFHARFRPPAIGMIHLPPLPGSPRWDADAGMDAVWEKARADAAALREGGFRIAMVENFGDIPFHGERVPPVTVAAMTRILGRLRLEFPELALGVNVLRNDARAALGIAAAVGAACIRVNVHVGAAVTDQGTLQGRAAETLRLRRELGCEQVGILADLRVKHARALAERPLADEAKDLRLRGLADAVIVSGAATGSGADPEQLRRVREALPDCPLLVGSGMTEQNLPEFAPDADGFIVGTSLQRRCSDDDSRRIDPVRAGSFLARLAELEPGGTE